MPFTLDTPLPAALPGKEAAALKKAFGMETAGDLVAHYPRRYALRGELTPIQGLVEGDTVTIVAEVVSVNKRSMRNRRGTILEVVISDGRGRASLTFFNQAWRENQLRVGSR